MSCCGAFALYFSSRSMSSYSRAMESTQVLQGCRGAACANPLMALAAGISARVGVTGARLSSSSEDAAGTVALTVAAVLVWRLDALRGDRVAGAEWGASSATVVTVAGAIFPAAQEMQC